MAQTQDSMRRQVHLFLEGKTPAGFYFTLATVGLIVLNIAGFIFSTVKGYDASFYENVERLEEYSVCIFTIEYLLRQWSSADDPEHRMVRSSTGSVDEFVSRLSWSTSFFSLVDLASILPYYFEMFSVQLTTAACKGDGVVIDLPASQFVRIFRLLRVMRLDGKYLKAFTVFDDIFAEQKDLMFKTGFVGGAVWVILCTLHLPCSCICLSMSYIFCACLTMPKLFLVCPNMLSIFRIFLICLHID